MLLRWDYRKLAAALLLTLGGFWWPVPARREKRQALLATESPLTPFATVLTACRSTEPEA